MIRLAVRCRPELAEAVLAELVALAPGGVEEEEGAGYVEYAIYGPPGELPDLGGVEAVVGEGLVDVTSTEIPDDWADRWRDFHHPVAVGGGRLVVRPSWRGGPASGPADPGAAAEEGGGVDVVIDPGRAFGTGAHPTTRMCLELLLSLAEAGAATGPLADWGSGSGVLAIAGAKLGWAPVIACDHEPTALEAAGANATANGVDLDLRKVNLRFEAPVPAPTATANLMAPLLREVAGRLEHVPDRLVCSGLLAREADGIASAFAPHGLVERERRSEGGWSALLLAAE